MRVASRSSIAVLVVALACGCRGESCADPAERAAIGYGGIEARVLAGRAEFLRDAVAPAIHREMERLLDAKAREQPKPRVPRSFEPGDSLPLPTSASPPDRTGTLAAARDWVARDLFKAMTDRVAADLGVSPDELESGWKQRRALPTRVVSYGTGTFLVVRRAASAPTPERSESEATRGGTEWREGRATRSGRSEENVERPKTGEEWWQSRGPTERREWLTACFVETSGLFEVLRVDQDACTDCRGAGRRMADGVAPPIVCWSCNGSGVVRSIAYR